MKTLHKYILSNFLTTFLLAILVLTFVMTVGLVFSSMKFIARGMSAMLVVRFLLQNLPGTLSYSVPIAALVSSLLVFSRLSSDSEISAMRSCGVSLTAIMRTPVLLSIALTMLCLWVNNNVSPDSTYTRQLQRKTFKITDVTSLIEPGTWTDIGDNSIYVARRAGDILYDIRVNQPMRNGRLREIRASSAVIVSNDVGPVQLSMNNVIVNPFSETRPEMVSVSAWQMPLSAFSKAEKSLEEKQEAASIKKRTKDSYSWELLRDIIAYSQTSEEFQTEEARKLVSRAKAEVASRATLAVACFCFVLIGIPLGLQSHRKESSVGVGISLVVAGVFYLFCIMGVSLSKHPDIPAHLITCLPIPLCLVLSMYLIHKNN